MKIGEVIEKLARNNPALLSGGKLNMTELAKQVEIPQQTLRRMIKGLVKSVNEKNVEVLANYFGVSKSQMRGESPLELTELDAELLGVWSTLNEADRAVVMRIVNSMSSSTPDQASS